MTATETALREALEKIAVESEGYAKRISDRWVNPSFWSIAKKARAALSLPAQDGWLPITSAPKDGTSVLGFCPDNYISVISWNTDLNGDGIAVWTDYTVQSFSYEEYMPLKPTHWRPLPPPPLPTGQKEA